MPRADPASRFTTFLGPARGFQPGDNAEPNCAGYAALLRDKSEAMVLLQTAVTRQSQNCPYATRRAPVDGNPCPGGAAVDTLRLMKPDLYTKAVLTIIAIMLTVVACNQYVSPASTARLRVHSAASQCRRCPERSISLILERATYGCMTGNATGSRLSRTGGLRSSDSR